jgi:uncharacterized membrane protein YoaK (UPF0700 family)
MTTRRLLLVLTAVTGVVDAVSILALGRVFVANMTGNVVFAGFAVAALLAVGMGIQNAVARKLALPDLTTTVLTMTLTGIGADLRGSFQADVKGRAAARAALGRRLLAIGTMLAGGITSAWLVLDVSVLSALSLAVALLAVTAIGAARPESFDFLG